MSSWFVNYSDFYLDPARPGLTLGSILVSILAAAVISARRSPHGLLDMDVALSVRGLAIVFLVLGHFSSICLQKGTFLDAGGILAVVSLLFLSGYGLTKKYGFQELGGRFWARRLRRLYVPLWLTLILFVALDAVLIGLTHPWPELVYNFAGGHFNGVFSRVNAPAWFVGFLLAMYALFFGVSRVRTGRAGRLALLYAGSLGVFALVKFSPLTGRHWVWLYYPLVFPSGVAFAMLEASKPELLERLADKKFACVSLFTFCCLVLYAWGKTLPDLSVINMFQPIPLVGALVCILLLYRNVRWKSRALMFIGTYSYEIYLLHLPFMAKYDFFLFRKPLALWFLFYAIALLVAAVGLSAISRLIISATESRRGLSGNE